MKKPSSDDRVTLKKSFSPLQVWSLALGCILGWGCFVLPGVRFLPEAGPLAAFIGFFAGGLLLAFVALSYGKMLENYPVAGGAFAYAYVGFGPGAAFVCGWALVLGYLCIIALNATAIALLTRFLFPGVLEWGHLYAIAGWDVYAGELVALCGTIAFFGYINYRGVGFAGSLQFILAIALILGVAAICFGSFTYSGASVDNLRPYFVESKSVAASIFSIVAIAPWLYVGFDTIPQTAEEFNFPHSQSVKLMLGAIFCGALIYGLVTLAVAVVMPYKELLAAGHVWPTGAVAEMTLGRAGSIALAVAVLAAILTGINGFYIASSRLIFGMARSRFLPAWFAKVHPRYHSPYNALLFSTILCMFAPCFGREALGWVVDMSAVGTIVAYGFTCLASFRLILHTPDISRPGWGKFTAIMGAGASALCLLLLCIPGSPAAMAWQSWVCLAAWIVLGIIFYLIRGRNVRDMDVSQQSYLILGSRDKKVFFDPDGREPALLPDATPPDFVAIPVLETERGYHR